MFGWFRRKPPVDAYPPLLNEEIITNAEVMLSEEVNRLTRENTRLRKEIVRLRGELEQFEVPPVPGK